jgi:hypothetical protein
LWFTLIFIFWGYDHTTVKYLGTTVTRDNQNEGEIKERIAAGN